MGRAQGGRGQGPWGVCPPPSSHQTSPLSTASFPSWFFSHNTVGLGGRGRHCVQVSYLLNMIPLGFHLQPLIQFGVKAISVM